MRAAFLKNLSKTALRATLLSPALSESPGRTLVDGSTQFPQESPQRSAEESLRLCSAHPGHEQFTPHEQPEPAIVSSLLKLGISLVVGKSGRAAEENSRGGRSGPGVGEDCVFERFAGAG